MLSPPPLLDIMQEKPALLLVTSLALSLLVLGVLQTMLISDNDLFNFESIMLKRAAQAAWELEDTGTADLERAEAIRNAMRHAWHGYEMYAWGADELRPETKEGKFGVLGGMNGFNGLGASIIDAMSTLHVMGLHAEFERAHAWVAENMTFDSGNRQSVSFFETTIRVLGGLMAAYDLSGATMFLQKAEELGTRLSPVFNGSAAGILTNNAALPWSDVSYSNEAVPLAELGSNLIEFGTLGRRTGNETFVRIAEDGLRFLHARYAMQPLLGTTVTRRDGKIADARRTIGAPVDSYFEYLLKYWILGGKVDNHWRDRWVNATDAALSELLVRSKSGSIVFTGEVNPGGHPSNKLTHLGCFYPGNVALGVISGAVTGEKAQKYLEFAESMGKACFQLYNATATGLGADQAVVNLETGEVTPTEMKYFQRPEVVESLFYLWRATHNDIYRNWGWQIVTAIEKHVRQPGGYSGCYNVQMLPATSDNVQQSWFLAETLKYLFLLFSDDSVMPLDRWVFNTEAHPVKVAVRNEYEAWVDWDWLKERATKIFYTTP